MKKVLVENQHGHGAVKLNKLHRKWNKLNRPKIARASLPFDWNKGYDVRDTIGPISIKNQGTSSSCSGQSGAYFLEIQERLRFINEGALSAKSIYAPIAERGGGATVIGVMTQIGSAGATKEATVPSYFVTGEPLSESMFVEKSWVTDITTQDALTRAGYTPYDIGENIDTIAETVRDYGAVIWEIAGQNNGTWLSAFPKPPVKGGADIWYHFMCVIGAKMVNGQKSLIVLNSWGESVGDHGVQYFTQEYFDKKGIIDAFTFIYDTKLVPNSDNHSVWAEIARWFRLKWKLV